MATQPSLLIMPPPLIGGALSDALSDVCRLSVAYIGPKSRTERPRKTKIGTEVAHVTRDSDTTFKVKRSNVKVTRPLYSPPPCWHVRQLQRWAWERDGRQKLCYVAVCSAARGASAPTGEERAKAYRGGRPLVRASLKAVLNVFFSLHHLNCLYLMNTKWYLL